MILDSSVVVSILLREPDYETLVDRLVHTDEVGISAGNLLETSIVLHHRLRRDPRLVLGQFLKEANISVIPFSEDHALAAMDASARFGKGRHPAALNFGDCIAYATAKLSGMPLLFVGEDFAKTDIARAT